MEKPLAVTWRNRAGGERLLGLTNAPILMVGFNRRFSPALQMLKELTGRRSPLMIQHGSMPDIPLDHYPWRHGGGRNIGEACHIRCSGS